MNNDFIGFIVTKNGCAVGLTRPKGAPKLGVLCGTKNFVLFGDRRTAKRALTRTVKFLTKNGNPLTIGGDKYQIQSCVRYFVRTKKGEQNKSNQRKKGRVPRRLYAGEELPFGQG